MRKKVLWIGHGNIESGFGRVGDNVLSYLSNDWDVSRLAIGYNGDPHKYPYRLYPAGTDGDNWGLNRVEKVYRSERPDVICIIMEPGNIMPYVQHLRGGLGSSVKIVGYAIVDGTNMKHDHAHWLGQCDVTIFPTEFAVIQAKKAGYYGFTYQIPHGVNPSVYRPCNKEWARRQVGVSQLFDPEMFVFGNVNMNQPRKRIDLTVEAFAKFLKLAGDPKEPLLYLHMRKNLEEGWDIGNLTALFDVRGRVMVLADEHNIAEAQMRYVYNAIDVQITTTAGEGFGLTTLEGMACGIPQIVPDFAALGDWAKPAAVVVPATERVIMHKQQNVVRFAPSTDDMAEAMLELYRNKEARETVGRMGRKLAMETDFRWSAIAAGFSDAFDKAISGEGKTGKFLVQGEAAPNMGAAGPSGAPLAVPRK